LSSPSLTSKIESLNCTREFLWRTPVEIEETITLDGDFYRTRILPDLNAKFHDGLDISRGTFLIQAQNIFLNQAEIFGFVWRIPKWYEFILVANTFDSRGVKIDLSGVNGASWSFPEAADHHAAGGTEGEPGNTTDNIDGGRGGDGDTGLHGGRGTNGHSFKGFFLDLVNIAIFVNGGNGGLGGHGGEGGRGGAGNGMRPGPGGDGGPGGNGGNGGNAGQIKLMFGNNPGDIFNRLHTGAGTGGSGGQGGPGGRSPSPLHIMQGSPGARGTDGTSGLGSTASVQSNVSLDDLFAAVSDELQCS